MNITKTVNGKDFLVSIEGRLDTATAPKFEEFITENIFKAVILRAVAHYGKAFCHSAHIF